MYKQAFSLSNEYACACRKLQNPFIAKNNHRERKKIKSNTKKLLTAFHTFLLHHCYCHSTSLRRHLHTTISSTRWSFTSTAEKSCEFLPKNENKTKKSLSAPKQL